MKDKMFDVVILGGGPGGYVAAIRGAQLGLKVALIEAEHLGGVCLNWGCIPTKALLKSAYLFHQAHQMASFGMSAPQIHANLKQMVQRSREITKTLSGGINNLLKKNGVDVFSGYGTLLGRKNENFLLDIKTPRAAQSNTPPKEESLHIQGRYVVAATGAKSRTLFPEHLQVWNAKKAMVPETLPKKLIIVGAGAIGLEFASFYQTLGTQVQVVELGAHILATEDLDIQKEALEIFTKKGITFHLSSTITHLEKTKTGGYMAQIQKGEEKISWQGDAVLVAIGVQGCTEGWGLEKTKAKVSKGHVVTHRWGETDEPGLYAIGDLAGPPWLAHKASHEALTVIEHIALQEKKGDETCHAEEHLDPKRIPACIYTFPQIASVGLTEQKALEQGYVLDVGRFPFFANGQALASGETQGFAKVLFDKKTGEFLGAHLLGSGVSEMIGALSVAKTMEATWHDLKAVIFPHPTISETVHEAVLDARKICLHMFNPSS